MPKVSLTAKVSDSGRAETLDAHQRENQHESQYANETENPSVEFLFINFLFQLLSFFLIFFYQFI